MKYPTAYKMAVVKELDRLVPNGAEIVDKYEPIIDAVDLHYNSEDYALKLLNAHERNIIPEEWLKHLNYVEAVRQSTIYKKGPRVPLLKSNLKNAKNGRATKIK